MNTYRDLRVWQEAVDLCADVYRVTDGYPRREMFGIVQQMRRAAVSVSSNIAEGKGRRTDRDFAHFLFLARGSVLELESQVEVSVKLGFLTPEKAEQLVNKTSIVARGLNALINAIQKTSTAAAATHH